MEIRDELISLMKRLVSVSETEEEEALIADRITLLSPDPNWSDYIFYPKKFIGTDGRVDIEAIVNEIIREKS